MKIKNPEISVQEAAEKLGVTERSILNYIRQKEIEALKVGKTWYIKVPSLDAFISRYGFAKVEKVETVESSSSNNSSPKMIPSLSDTNRTKKSQSLSTLRLFEILKGMLLPLELEGKTSTSYVRDHFNNLKLEAIEFLGAGFYAYEFQHKKSYYNLSRQKISGILSLLHSFEPENNNIKKIEEDLLPAFSSLIKKIENKNTSIKNVKL